MKLPVMLHITGRQNYIGQEPDVIELVTDGYLLERGDVWEIGYEESALTGLEGVTSIFRISPRGVTLRRSGRLQSQMIFQEGKRHESLYQMDCGALMISICAQKIRYNLSRETGGTVDLTYQIEIESAASGHVEYHLDVTRTESTAPFCET